MVIHKWGYNSLKEVITDLKLVKGPNCTNTMFCKIRMCTARCKKHMVQNSLKKIHIFHHCPRYVIYTLWLFIIAMENGPFTDDDDVPIKTSVYHGFSIAMLNNQMVYIYIYQKCLADVLPKNWMCSFGNKYLQMVPSHCLYRVGPVVIFVGFADHR